MDGKKKRRKKEIKIMEIKKGKIMGLKGFGEWQSRD